MELLCERNSYNDAVFQQKELNPEAGKSRSQFKLNENPKIFLKLIYSELENDKTKCFVWLTTKNKKSTSYVPGYPIGWTTTNGDFLGTVHRGFGSEYLVQWTYKEHWYSSLKYFTINGVNSWFIYPASVYYGGVINTEGWYKLNMIIRPDINQTEVNYLVAFDLGDMYGHNCAVGSYDYYNCYIGTPPTGTTAFFWYYSGIDETWCMYSPVNGNQCPLPGSSFDGANCKYVQIPNDSESFIYDNKWYIRPEVINLK